MADTYNSKVVLSDGTVLIDLTADTVTADKLFHGITAHGKNGAPIEGTMTGTATASDILSGKTAVVSTGAVSGGMTNVGAQTSTITAKAQSVAITQGYHNGSGTVAISSTEQGKIVAGNIASDTTILGVKGTLARTSDATITVVSGNSAELLTGKTAYANNAKVTGTMPNIGKQTSSITTKAQSVSISQGYHDGSGTVSISATEQAKIIASNIKQGITILGVEGSMSGSEGLDLQAKSATPTWSEQTITPTAVSGKTAVLSQVTIAAIPITYTTNTAGGQTVTIG